MSGSVGTPGPESNFHEATRSYQHEVNKATSHDEEVMSTKESSAPENPSPTDPDGAARGSKEAPMYNSNSNSMHALRGSVKSATSHKSHNDTGIPLLDFENETLSENSFHSTDRVETQAEYHSSTYSLGPTHPACPSTVPSDHAQAPTGFQMALRDIDAASAPSDQGSFGLSTWLEGTDAPWGVYNRTQKRIH